MVTASPWVRGSLRVTLPEDAVPGTAGGIYRSSRGGGTALDIIRSHKVLSVIIAALIVFGIISYVGNHLWW